MASRVGFCWGTGAGPGGGASPLSWVTVTSRKSWGAAGGAWPIDRFSTSSGLLLAGIAEDTTACEQNPGVTVVVVVVVAFSLYARIWGEG